MSPGRRIAQQFAAVVSMVAKLAKHLVALLHRIKNVRGVLVQGADGAVPTNRQIGRGREAQDRTSRGRYGRGQVRNSYEGTWLVLHECTTEPLLTINGRGRGTPPRGG